MFGKSKTLVSIQKQAICTDRLSLSVLSLSGLSLTGVEHTTQCVKVSPSCHISYELLDLLTSIRGSGIDAKKTTSN